MTSDLEEYTARMPYEHTHKLVPPSDDAETGAFVPLWTRTDQGQTIEGEKVCNGAFFRCDADGSNLERIAWGFRSSFGYRVASDGRLICTHNGANPIAPRKLWFDQDALYEVHEGEWYGWPDFFSGLPITDSRFSHKEGPQEFLLSAETHQKLLKGQDQPRGPPIDVPASQRPPGVRVRSVGIRPRPDTLLVAEMGTIVPVFKGNQLFWPAPDREERVEIERQKPQSAPQDAEFDWPGFKVQAVDLNRGEVRDFLTNVEKGPATANRGGGLERPVQVEWGPDGALYVVDTGVISIGSTRDGR